ncbi:predicted protein [Chaetoceros tenuissimus]|uniref:Helicase-associated domain-containing protein n=1 Tax=Chaetoceros tenuissimus TaxID=426638 RepID=A0AAD3HFJ2_9STRA|nr:predicted protein [Chaetoceros tenuissimus]
MSTTSPLHLLDDSFESQLICSLYLDICHKDLELQKSESLLILQSIVSGSILRRDFQAPAITNARIAAKLTGHLDLFESCSDANIAKRCSKEDVILSHTFGYDARQENSNGKDSTRQTIEPQNDVHVVASKLKGKDSHIIPPNPIKRKHNEKEDQLLLLNQTSASFIQAGVDQLLHHFESPLESRPNIDLALLQVNLPKPNQVGNQGRLDFYEKVLALKKYKEKNSHMNINTDDQEFRDLINFCRRNRFHYRQHLQGVKVMPKYKIDLLNEIGFDWESKDDNKPKTLTTPIGTLVKKGNGYVLL